MITLRICLSIAVAALLFAGCNQANNAQLPTDQGNNQKDIDTTAEIRRRVVDLKDVSISGRNVMIVTKDGKVTLRGPVASEVERKLIEKIAQDVAGPDHMDTELKVAQ